MNKIFIVGGGKGGVGKSMVSMALIDAVRESGNELAYVETDDSNPDVYKAVNGTVDSKICNLDAEGGYIALGSIIEANPNAAIIINSAARATNGLVKHGGILADVAKELNRELVLLWPINRQRDGLELLKGVMDADNIYSAVYVVLNTYFGGQEKFSRYENSKLKHRVTGTVVFPELNDLVADKLVDARLPVFGDGSSFTIAEKSALRRFREAANLALGGVIHGRH